MSIEGQGHFLTLAQGCVHTKIQTGFSQKLMCRSEPNLYEGFQVQGNDAGHMTKMAATPIYGKNPSKIIQPIIVCSNDDPRVTLTYFMARSNLVT